MKPVRAVLCWAIALAGMPTAQQLPEARTLPTFRAQTRLVVIDIIATDKTGQPVLDLKPDEVKVFEDGREKEIRAFELNSSDGVPAATLQPPLPILPPHTFSNLMDLNTDRPLTAILFDALNTAFANQSYAREKLVKFLDTVPASQPLALFTLGRRLRLAADFTTDISIVKGALLGAKERAQSSGDAPAVTASPVTPPDFGMTALFSTGNLDQAVEQALADVQKSYADVDQSLRCALLHDAMQSLVRALAGVPGRKNLLWIADTFPLNPTDLNSACPNLDSSRTAELLATAQVAIYPIDAAGLGVFGIRAEDSLRISGKNPGPGYSRVLGGQAEARAVKVSNMKWLAEVTGGKAYFDRNDLDRACADSFRDMATYYTIAYYADKASGPNPKARLITVKVSRPGVQVRHRTQYVPHEYSELTPEQRSRDFGNAMDPETPISSALPFRAQVRETRDGKTPVHFSVQASRLLWSSEEADRQLARVNCVAAVYRKDGKFVGDFTQTVEGSLMPAAYERVLRDGFPCDVSIEVPSGEYLVRFGVRDERSGLIGTANGKLTVAPSGAQ